LSTCDPKDINLGGISSWGAGQPTYSISIGSGTDTFTIDTANMAYTSTTTPTYTTISNITGASYNWNTPNYDTVNITGDGITMKEGADIKVGGKSLIESIEKIEERLGILRPNPELEDRWEQLKTLRQQYKDLEKELLEKEKMWKILKEK
jgi:hypothetical protein